MPQPKYNLPMADQVTLSPFDSLGDVRLSNSKVKTWRRCPFAYALKYGLHLRPKKRKIQLDRGDWVHDCLMRYFDGEDWRAEHQRRAKAFNSMFEEEREEWGLDYPNEILGILLGYFAHWRDENPLFHTVDTELDEIMTLPNGLRFNFIIDRIVEDKQNGGLWLVDVKTGKSFFDQDFMLLDAQLTRYFWCAERMGYKPLLGVMFDEINTSDRTRPKYLEKSGRLEMKSNIKCDYITYLRTIKKHDLDPHDYTDFLAKLKAQSDRWYRRTQLTKDGPITTQMMRELVMTAREIQRAHQTGQFPRTPDKSCVWGCDYTEPCITALNGGNIEPIVNMKYETRRRDID
jgi:RecB family exonuclease